MKHDFFEEVNHVSAIADDLITFFIQSRQEAILYHDFVAKVIPKEIFLKDSFLSNMYKKYPFNAALLIMEPGTIYNWHKDGRRKATINMVVKDTESICIFMDPSEEQSMVNHITELKYQPMSYYLFNTEHRHLVVNKDIKPRFLFSVEFDDKEDGSIVDYKDITHESDLFEISKFEGRR
tara:strand:+ start:119 stop:655 length:537 start_codon:yes stop_codon:yes gene_type:complete